MGYIDKSLLDGEELVYRTRRHKIIFILPFLWLIFSIAFYAVKWIWPFTLEIITTLLVFAIIFVSAAVIHALIVWIQYCSTEFGVTNQRVIVKEGFIKRNTIEVFLKRVESVQVEQSILGRLLDFGNVTVSGTGGVSDPLSMIRAPLEFKKQVQQQLAKH